ncbi:B3 domain-containing protein Os05g0481400-like [Tasmannia lanceolata]|uniref:B3 domain-containing protein Os05g0481400-like n=1 Tax=Tasmannia lanceolata TaxID=3420 RepID=UPI0040634F0E
MAKIRKSNSYEEARKQRLQDNLKRFQDLGISSISKSLLAVETSKHKSLQRHVNHKSKTSLEVLELRRSSRARNPVPSYRDDVDNEIRYSRRSSVRRLSVPINAASYEERVYAIKYAEKVQSNLKSGNPSFIKSMVRSHVSSCFWLGLPSTFCKDHLPSRELKMVLEDENGSEYDVIYIGSRTGLSGGWKGFSLDHGLDDGDALVFELSEPERFKVYIVKVSEFSNQDNNGNLREAVESAGKSKRTHKIVENGKGSTSQKIQVEIDGSKKQAKRAAKRTKQE